MTSVIIVAGLPYGGDTEISKMIQAAIARAGGPPKMLSLVLPAGATCDILDCEITDSYVVQEGGVSQLTIEVGAVTGRPSRIAEVPPAVEAPVESTTEPTEG